MLVSFLQNPFQDIRPLASLPSPVGVRSLQTQAGLFPKDYRKIIIQHLSFQTSNKIQF
jgi:hypothetical protein